MRRYRGQFDATDPRGRQYTLVAWDGEDGAVALETADGHVVARVERGRYRLGLPRQLVELTSTDPNAP